MARANIALLRPCRSANRVRFYLKIKCRNSNRTSRKNCIRAETCVAARCTRVTVEMQLHCILNSALRCLGLRYSYRKSYRHRLYAYSRAVIKMKRKTFSLSLAKLSGTLGVLRLQHIIPYHSYTRAHFIYLGKKEPRIRLS